jgi:uncharacterized phiE125 gp8 family phage protein
VTDPVLITPPAAMPVSLVEAKAHLRVDHDDDDAVIEGMVAAATSYLDGYNGILGRAIMPQVWREEWDGFHPAFPLRLGPVSAVAGISYTDGAGLPATATGARVVTSAGAAFVFPAVAASWPSGSAVSVEYTAGYATVPPALKMAILLHIGALYENREGVAEKSMAVLPLAYEALIAPYRRYQV